MSAPTTNIPALDSSQVKLTEDILKLVEQLAEVQHANWVRERQSQGWKYGPKRDDDKKENPLLIPYSELPEEEKKINRANALETLKAILELGYDMQSPAGQSIRSQPDAAGQVHETIRLLKTNPKLTVADLRRIWEEHSQMHWAASVEVYRRMVDYALKLGEAFLAFDISQEGLSVFKNDLRLTQLQALALARTGATRRANQILDQLRQSGHQDEETLGILARTHKDFWLMTADPAEKKKHLNISFDLYYSAYQRNHGYYSGINAASMGLLAGKTEIARKLAQEVTDLCKALLEKTGTDSEERYWLDATLAEAAIILGKFDEAEKYYRAATVLSGDKLIIVSRTRAQARLLLEHITGNPNMLDACFHLPRIVVFSGHMFDRPGRRRHRFPVAFEEPVRDAIAAELKALDAQIGYSSLACGGDLLFAESILERGGEIHIALPFNKADFRRCSVDIIPGIDFGKRFEHVLARAATVTILNEWGNANDGAAFDYCNRALNGMALLKGRFFGMDVVPLAVWDGQPGDGIGGTQTFVDYWSRQGDGLRIIRLDKIVPADYVPPRNVSALETATTSLFEPQINQEIKAMLFADIVGFTKLTEMQVPRFVEHFMGKVAELMQQMPNPPVHKNTWGDAVCCVFNSVKDAGLFALRLRDMVRGTPWQRWGLPGDLNIRIALHAGPVYACYDPVLGKLTYNGSHVNRTARIEPVAEEGQIYASLAFAALATAEHAGEFTCDYVGTKQLAKKYGAIPVFLVRPAA